MKAVFCLCLVLTVVAAETTENTEYSHENVGETTQGTLVDQTTINNNQAVVEPENSRSFGNQNIFSGNLYTSKTPSSQNFGFSLQHPLFLGKQHTFIRHQNQEAVPVDTLKSNYGYGVYGANAGLGYNYGLVKGFQQSYPATYTYGYNTGISQSQGKITNVDTQVSVDTTQQKHINTLHTITKQIPVPQLYPVPYQVIKTVAVPQPYPVPVVKAVPVPYKVQVPVPVDKPIPVKVPHQVPVPVRVNVPYPVEKPYPVPVEKTVKVPVERPVYIRVPQPIAVQVPQPYPVKVVKKYPVQVPTPVVVKVPEIINVHKVDYAVAPVQYHGCGHHSQQFHQEVPVHLEGGTISQNVAISDAAISENAYGDALTSQEQAANYETSNFGAYQIQPAQLVGVYHDPAYYGSEPSVIDAKYTFKRETVDKKLEKKDKKKL